MCGIVGFTGQHQAAPILLDGLSKLEYRGYDSAGLAVRDGSKLAEVVKSTGKLRNLAVKTDNGAALAGTCGIGHTRWATHGEPSQTNAHPHVSGNCTGTGSGPVEAEVVGVHNGIIENYKELKAELKDFKFQSETDTEVLAALIDSFYDNGKYPLVNAVVQALKLVKGTYGIAVVSELAPSEMVVARSGSPLVIGVGQRLSFCFLAGVLSSRRSPRRRLRLLRSG